MSSEQQTQTAEGGAVGAPVQREVRPVAWTARSWLRNRDGGHFVSERRHAFDVPLYDQAAIYAAVAAEHERMRDLCSIDMAQATLKASELAQAAERERWEAVVFDGWRVLKGLDEAAAKRTTHQNVSDTLDALMRVLRA